MSPFSKTIYGIIVAMLITIILSGWMISDSIKKQRNYNELLGKVRQIEQTDLLSEMAEQKAKSESLMSNFVLPEANPKYFFMELVSAKESSNENTCQVHEYANPIIDSINGSLLFTSTVIMEGSYRDLVTFLYHFEQGQRLFKVQHSKIFHDPIVDKIFMHFTVQSIYYEG